MNRRVWKVSSLLLAWVYHLRLESPPEVYILKMSVRVGWAYTYYQTLGRTIWASSDSLRNPVEIVFWSWADSRRYWYAMVSSVMEAKISCKTLRGHRQHSITRSRVSIIMLIGSKPGVKAEGTETETGESISMPTGVFLKLVIYPKTHISGS